MGSIHVKLHNGQTLDYCDFDTTHFEVDESSARYDVIRVFTPSFPGATPCKSTERQIWKTDVTELRII
jgi:hypothetical protein